MIFNKPLAFCKSDFIVAKAESFLKKIGLYDLYVTEMCIRDSTYIDREETFNDTNPAMCK